MSWDTRLKALEIEFYKVLSRWQNCKKDIDRIESIMSANQTEIDKNIGAIEIFSMVSDTNRDKAKKVLESVVSMILTNVLEKEYRFITEFNEKGGLLVVEFYVEDEVCKCLVTERGGGIVDLVSFSLRICVIELLDYFIPNPIVFDEPFKHLSYSYMKNVFKVVKYLSKRFSRQFIIVTHKADFFLDADNIIRL